MITELTAIVKRERPKVHWKKGISKKKDDRSTIAKDAKRIEYIIFIKVFIVFNSPNNTVSDKKKSMMLSFVTHKSL